MDKKDTQRRWIKMIVLSLGILVLGALYALIAKYLVGIPCVFYQITGWQCPGCGITRAILSLLRLDIVQAFRYDLLFPLEIFYLLWVYAHASARYLKGGRFAYIPPCQLLDIAILIVIVAWGILRNLL